MTTVKHINPEALHSSPAFSWAVRVPAGADTIHVGGQNGVGADGAVVGAGMAEQTQQALANLRTCLEAAGAEITDVVKWTILYVDGADVQEGLAAFNEFWPRPAAPPRDHRGAGGERGAARCARGDRGGGSGTGLTATG